MNEMIKRDVREFIKISPLAKENYRKRVFDTCLAKMRQNRQNNFQSIRQKTQDVDEITRDLVYGAMTSTPIMMKFSTPNEEIDNSRDVYIMGERERIHLTNAVDDFQILEDFFGTEEHRLLMENISEAILAEYQDNSFFTPFDNEMENLQIPDEYLEDASGNELDWYINNEPSNGMDTTITTIICPVCRRNNMSVNSDDGLGGSIRCINCTTHCMLPDCEEGLEAKMEHLRTLLATTYDTHLMYCNGIPCPVNSLKFQQQNIHAGDLISYCLSCGFVQRLL